MPPGRGETYARNVWRGRRSDLLLGGLALVAVANGLLLGLSLYGLLAAALKVVHGKVPPWGYAWLAGAGAAAIVLIRSLLQERRLRDGENTFWMPFPSDPRQHPLVERFQALVAASSLRQAPTLGWIDSPEQNAFTVGHSRNRAAIVLSAGLIERLPLAQLDAVLAQQLAQVESEDVKAVGLADAVAGSLADLSRAKGRFLWGPRAILADMRPLLLVSIAGLIFLAALPQMGANSSGLTLLFGLVSLVLLYNLWQGAKRSCGSSGSTRHIPRSPVDWRRFGRSIGRPETLRDRPEETAGPDRSCLGGTFGPRSRVSLV